MKYVEITITIASCSSIRRKINSWEMGQDTHILIKISQLKVLILINDINKLYKMFLATILLHFVTSQVLFLDIQWEKYVHYASKITEIFSDWLTYN